MEVTISKHVIHQHLTNPYLTQTPSVAGTPFLFLFFSSFVCLCACFSSDEIYSGIFVWGCVCGVEVGVGWSLNLKAERD